MRINKAQSSFYKKFRVIIHRQTSMARTSRRPMNNVRVRQVIELICVQNTLKTPQYEFQISKVFEPSQFNVVGKNKTITHCTCILWLF